MSILTKLREIKINEKAVGTRTCTVLEKTEREPAFTAEVYFLPNDDWERIKAPYMKRGDTSLAMLGFGTKLTSEQEEKIRKRTMKKIVQKWDGLTAGNLRRCSERAFLSPETVAEMEAGEQIDCTPESIEELAMVINNQEFNKLLFCANDQEAWATERDDPDEDEEKNAEASSSA